MIDAGEKHGLGSYAGSEQAGRGMPLARFAYHRRAGVVVLVDLGTGATITNDAEAVVRFCVEHLGVRNGEPIIYRDTIGRYDELFHQDGEFVGFAPIGAATELAAVAKAAPPDDDCHIGCSSDASVVTVRTVSVRHHRTGAVTRYMRL